MGIIEPVPLNPPTRWCARIVLVPKDNREPRRAVDFNALNNATKRQTHHTKSPFMIAAELPANTKMLVIGMLNAYHAVPTRAEDKNNLTFITPWGQF